MKKLALTIVMIVGSYCLFSQIKINSSGQVGIGGIEPSTSYDLNGDKARFSKIGIGTDPTGYALTTQDVHVNGQAIIEGKTVFQGHVFQGKNSYFGGYFEFRLGGPGFLLFDNSGRFGTSCIHPNIENKCSLGSPSTGFKYIYSYNYLSPSDGRIKENIRNISSPLGMIMAMKGVKYDLKKSNIAMNGKYAEYEEQERKNKLGFIAQDLAEIVPEAVVYDDSTDSYAVNYISIIPILVEALKEQQQQIQRLQRKELKSTEDSQMFDQNYLEENHPNPFNEQTTINFFLSSDIKDAHLYIYDLTGKQVKSISIVQRQEGEIIIHSNELTPGMYKYALVGDDHIIGTKTMILTD